MPHTRRWSRSTQLRASPAIRSISGSARKSRWARCAWRPRLRPKQEQINIHNCFLGGGFGRRGNNDEMRQAIQVAKQVGKPAPSGNSFPSRG